MAASWPHAFFLVGETGHRRQPTHTVTRPRNPKPKGALADLCAAVFVQLDLAPPVCGIDSSHNAVQAVEVLGPQSSRQDPRTNDVANDVALVDLDEDSRLVVGAGGEFPLELHREAGVLPNHLRRHNNN